MIYELDAKSWARIRVFCNQYTRAELMRKYDGKLAYELARVARGSVGRGQQKPLSTALVTESLKYCRDPNAGPSTGAGPVEHLQE